MSAQVYYLSMAAAVVAMCVIMKPLGYLSVAAKGGGVCLGVVMALAFAFGMIDGFGFAHTSSDPGWESAIAAAVLTGIAIGPIVFVAGGCGYAAFRYMKKRSQTQAP